MVGQANPAASDDALEYETKHCETKKKGHDLDIRVKVLAQGDTVEQTEVNATDRAETTVGFIGDKHVNLQRITMEYIDEAGFVVFTKVESDSPFEKKDDFNNIEKVKVTVIWKVHGKSKTKVCSVHLDD